MASKSKAAKSSPPRVAEPEVSDAAVHAKTGRNWDDWFAELDAAGAKDWTHKEIVSYLGKHDDLSGWWRQGITVGYERARGKRAVHETTNGFAANKSKTIAAPVDAVFAFWVDNRKRKRWLDMDPDYSTNRENKTLRFAWPDTSERVNVGFLVKAENRTTVTIEHNKLPNQKAVSEQKDYWSERLDALADLVT